MTLTEHTGGSVYTKKLFSHKRKITPGSSNLWNGNALYIKWIWRQRKKKLFWRIFLFFKMTVFSLNIPSLKFVSHKGGKKGRWLLTVRWIFIGGFITHWPHFSNLPKHSCLFFFFFVPKHARSIPQGPCDAWGDGETPMNTGSIQSTLSIHMFMRCAWHTPTFITFSVETSISFAAICQYQYA